MKTYTERECYRKIYGDKNYLTVEHYKKGTTRELVEIANGDGAGDAACLHLENPASLTTVKSIVGLESNSDKLARKVGGILKKWGITKTLGFRYKLTQAILTELKKLK